ncbi:hypothetical protein BUALT_Bualt09G0018600 [Buddleja alternifolia]|uniref:RING-type domain-containing protein n=1 Tax=Buddleja alternifolia TaxID=168488 RepID=A0AAV6WZS1_9LAMI|nr:hypothetical protein BUALT_Bualt09G0018600 [Buddleja alternifolia]
MGLQQSKDELLYQQVKYGNVEGIKALRTQGAGLEWIDSEAKTPLIVACMNPELHDVAKTLIELGANVNAYRPGRHAGTPLHHAAKRGLEQTVRLLLSQGANALIMNDDCETPLDVARAKGDTNVVRSIERHVCLFSGWLQEPYGPGFLERLAPKWVVILPCGSRNLRNPLKLELAIYADLQNAQPRTSVPLWKANLEEPNFNQPDPAAIISDNSKSTRIKLAPAHENEKHELQRFCNACKGIPQEMHPLLPINNQMPTAPATAPNSEDEELTMAINASLQSAAHETPPHTNTYIASSIDAPTTSSNSINTSTHEESHISTTTSTSHETSGSPPQHSHVHNTMPSASSAPPVTDDGPILYPSVDLSSLTVDAILSGGDEKKEENGASSCCTICLDAPLEGACVPCGHMAGCMSCLNEVKTKKWGCPVCRAKIDQVIRIYAV